MKILVFNPSFIGDSILTTPLIKAIKHFYPKAEIYFCVRPESKILFENVSAINSVITYDKRGFEKGVSGVKRFVEKLGKGTFDIVISPHKSLRSTLLIKLLKPKISISFKESVLSFLYTYTVKREMSLHEVVRNLLLLKPLINDFSIDKVVKIAGKPVVGFDKKLHENVKKYLSYSFSDSKFIGFAPGSVWKTKMWPAEYYATVIDKVVDFGFVPVVFGSKSEIETVKKVEISCKNKFINLAGKTNLLELSSWIRAMDVMICNDSAPMHIAVSNNVPVVAIFGPTVKELGFTPYDEKSIVVENNSIECRPCGLHGGNRCPKKHFRCMMEISPEEVFSALKKVINV